MRTRHAALVVPGVLFVSLACAGCASEDGELHDIAGVGQIRYRGDVRTVATVTFPTGGAVHFQESLSEEGHACAGFFPADAPGDPAVAHDAADGGCLSMFVALTPADTPIPAALLLGIDDAIPFEERPIVDAVDDPIEARELPLVADAHPMADNFHEDANHSCSGTSGSAAHWESVHCDEGGADHCDPDWDDDVVISSGATYLGSFQTGLFCGTGSASSTHAYWNGTGWTDMFGWSHAAGFPATEYLAFSTHRGAANWKRRITSVMGGNGQFRHYTKMCAGIVDCPISE